MDYFCDGEEKDGEPPLADAFPKGFGRYVDKADALPPVPLRLQNHIGSLLRSTPAFWTELAAHLPPALAGLHAEFIVLAIDGRAVAVTDAATAASVEDHLRCTIGGMGFNGVAARHMAAAVLAHVLRVNSAAVRLCRAATANVAEGRQLLLRLAIKPIHKLAVDAPASRVWFPNGHANLLVLNPALGTAVLLEPTGTELLQQLGVSVLQALVRSPRPYRLFHNQHMFRRMPLDVDDSMCTTWCAVLALLLLANPVGTPERFWQVVWHAFYNRSMLLRLFFVHACLTLQRMRLL